MNTKLLLGASAIVMGASGLAGTFAPQELATALGITSTGVLPLLIQLLAALLFGFAMVNWMARGSLIGGIYNRPVLVGNVAHFLIGGLAAIKAVLAGEHRPLVIGIAAVYAVFAIGFGTLLFRGPVTAK
jgi:hypothetical protein